MSYTNLMYHAVFSTKDRRPVLPRERRQRLAEYIGGIIRNMDGQMLAADGGEDHLHVVMVASPKTAISDLVRDVKANSSGWVHKTFEDLAVFGWQDEYSAFSVWKSMLPRVIEYVRNQEEHHRKMTFRDELIALLKRHGVEYDERYI
jgi:REP element-mobilizing transposase RayT